MRITVLLFTLIITLSCTENNTQQTSPTLTKQVPPITKQHTATQTPGKYYILAPSGLNLRVSHHQNSKVVLRVNYGEVVNVTGKQQGDNFKVDNIEGGMIPVTYKSDVGYLFSGYLSSIPVPKANNDRFKGLEAYDQLLTSKEIPHQFKLEERNEGKYSTFVLPVSNYQMAYLISKQLFYIPEDYDYPTNDKEVKSTPENPSKAAQEGPYDYVTHRFEITRSPDQKMESFKYINQTEVGSQVIAIKQVKDGFLVELQESVH